MSSRVEENMDVGAPEGLLVDLTGTETAENTQNKSQKAEDAGDKSNKTQKTTKDTQPEEKPKDGPKYLDLAFAMDCTGSMGSYIHTAQASIRSIVEEIVSKESADVRLALVQYRDHPPQDSSFVTRTNAFTESVRSMKSWLDGCSANGGGDTPEAVADALHQLLKLSWRDEATKICVFIADAPPHGLGCGGDGFPNGCPDGLDPMRVTNQLAEKGVILYMVGCEPSITPYKDFFMALTHMTGGQYVPLAHAKVLAPVIVGGAQEEISLQQLRDEINREVVNEYQSVGAGGTVNQADLIEKVQSKMAARGTRSKKLQMNQANLAPAPARAQQWSGYDDLSKVRAEYSSSSGATSGFGFGGYACAAPVPPPPPSGPAPSSSAGGGWFGGLFDSFWGSPAKGDSSSTMGGDAMSAPLSAGGAPMVNSAPPMAPPPPPSGMASRSMGMASPMMAQSESAAPPTPAMTSASTSDKFDVTEDLLDIAQTSRMVQQSIMVNKLKSQTK